MNVFFVDVSVLISVSGGEGMKRLIGRIVILHAAYTSTSTSASTATATATDASWYTHHCLSCAAAAAASHIATAVALHWL